MRIHFHRFIFNSIFCPKSGRIRNEFRSPVDTMAATVIYKYYICIIFCYFFTFFVFSCNLYIFINIKRKNKSDLFLCLKWNSGPVRFRFNWVTLETQKNHTKHLFYINLTTLLHLRVQNFYAKNTINKNSKHII